MERVAMPSFTERAAFAGSRLWEAYAKTTPEPWRRNFSKRHRESALKIKK